MTLFVDTSVWYAAAASGDRHNRRSKEVLATDEPRVTSDHILVETWLLARHRLGRNVAEALVGRIRDGIARIETTPTPTSKEPCPSAPPFATRTSHWLTGPVLP